MQTTKENNLISTVSQMIKRLEAGNVVAPENIKEEITKILKKVATHFGKFHADEVLAIATLKILNPNLETVRTRNPEIYNAYDIVVDVGEGEFDHHQKGGNGVRPNGVPYASFGLVWKVFGRLVVELFGGDQRVADIIEQNLVQGVDALDNGYKPNSEVQIGFESMSISESIDAFNPTWDDETANEDEAFAETVEWAKSFLIRYIKTQVANVKGKEIVVDAIEKQENGVIVLSRYVPWDGHLYDDERNKDILYVVFPDSKSGEWRIQTVPVAPKSFVARKSLPKAWGGLRGEKLNEVVGIHDGIFVLDGLFIGGAVSKESILKMAELAVNNKN